jgi:hypothetical protein
MCACCAVRQPSMSLHGTSLLCQVQAAFAVLALLNVAITWRGNKPRNCHS